MSVETIHSLKSELDDFILLKRKQLSVLAQSLNACRVGVRTDASAIIQTSDASGNRSAETRAHAPTEAKRPEQETDPIARLNAIKLRLAKQIENH